MRAPDAVNISPSTGHEPPLRAQVLDHRSDRSWRRRVRRLRQWPTTTSIPGGAKARSTRSIPARIRTRTATASATSAGIIERLDHLQWLGIRGVWLSPVTVSPNADFGYDVADFYDVDPSLGTLADLDELIADAGARGIRILMDLVPNHTSIDHPWFQESRSSRDNPKRDWYVWADPEAGRLAAEQLGQQLLRLGVDARRRRPGSTTCRTSCPSRPTSTGGTRRSATSSTASCGSGSTAASPGSASTSRTWSSRTASCATTRPRPTTTRSSSSCAASSPVYNENRPEVHDVHRRLRADRRLLRPAPHARRRDVHATHRRRDPVLRQRRRAQPRVQHPVRAAAARGRRRCGR